MLAQAGRVMVEFRFSDNGALPKAIRRHDPNTETAREKRFAQQKGRPLLERHCAVPSAVPTVLERLGLRLIDARYVEEVVQKRWKIYKRVRFTFDRISLDSIKDENENIESARRALRKYTSRRWNIAKIAYIQWDMRCVTMYFDNELEHPADPMDLDDPLAASFGIIITKAKPRTTSVESSKTGEKGEQT